MTTAAFHTGKTPGNKGRKFPNEVLTPGECRAILNAIKNRGPTGYRNRALVVTWWRAGLRLQESLDLFPKDVDLARRAIRVLHGKGDEDRVVYIDSEAAAVIDAWMRVREGLGINGRSPLYCTVSEPMRGGKMWGQGAREMLQHYARVAGLTRRVNPHALRTTCACELHFDEGQPVTVVKDILGHKSLDTTYKYLRRHANKQLADAMHHRTWG